MRLLLAGLFSGIVWASVHAIAAETSFDLKSARLTLDDRGVANLRFANGTAWPGDGTPAFKLKRAGKTLRPIAIQKKGSALRVEFEPGVFAVFEVSVHSGFALFRLKEFSGGEGVETFQLFQINAPGDAEMGEILNSATSGKNFAAVLAGDVNVHATATSSGSTRGDRNGGSHKFELAGEAKVGKKSIRFSATSDAAPGGWSVRGRLFDTSIDLRGCVALQAWVYGDQQGELLKFQLIDGLGEYCDTYQKIDFQGWKLLTFPVRAPDKFAMDRVTGINLYYNGLPAGKTVTCLIDQIEAQFERGGNKKPVVLENFESRDLSGWDLTRRGLSAQTVARYGHKPASFAVMACGTDEFSSVMPELERAAGLPSPRFNGEWNKASTWVTESYLFLMDFGAADFTGGLALAKKGGFKTVLIGQSSWCEATGHYAINKRNFPAGMNDLRETVRKFQNAGIRVGLHFLAPSIDPPDRYLTPIPDKRLLRGSSAELAAPVKTSDTFIPLRAIPADFPEVDGGYEGRGTVVQIGNELIQYGGISKTAPLGLKNCIRGHLKTVAAAHNADAEARHLSRAYGYHMFDLDTDLLNEAAGHFAAVADGCGIDMVYFDGSERMQGDHWHYNARLHRAFYDKLKNKNLLFQASSVSHYSWHMLARSASADGHGDLKGYLDERVPTFSYFARQGMPLDIGWYYGYDPESTLDQYEYILAKTLAYDSSMSYQVSVSAAEKHPFTNDILDLIARYERLRLAKKTPPKLMARMKVAPELSGKKVNQQGSLLHHRVEYRLVGEEGNEEFQRVVYTPWREIKSDAAKASDEWNVNVSERSQIGFNLHLRPSVWTAAGPSYFAKDAVTLEAFDDLAAWTRGGMAGVRVIEHGAAGSTSPGVKQRMELLADGKEGSGYASYTAESNLPNAQGWSVLSKGFDPPLNLSQHAAIGFWLLGDGKGGLFKLQLSDGAKAMDYYIKNDFTGWRYQQLERPRIDVIDYRTVRALSVYYNGLPAQTKVTCGIDGIKALARVDKQTISAPWVEVGGKRVALKETLAAGEYLFAWPGAAAQIYPGKKALGSRGGAVVAPETVEPGSHAVRFGCDGFPQASMRVRVVLQPAERYSLRNVTKE